MSKAVIDGSSYVLAHTPNILKAGGTTQTEARKNGRQDYLDKLDNYLRDFEECRRYAPNQAYIGGILPEELEEIETPWYEQDNLLTGEQGGRFSSRGEIMPEDEFYALMQAVDVFDLVLLAENFCRKIESKIEDHPVLKNMDFEPESSGLAEIEELIEDGRAEPLRWQGELIGCVKEAHGEDKNLSAHVMLENIAAKASGVLAMKHLAAGGLDLDGIDYVIECSEEACGDMNQRGGGNFAKAIAEKAGCMNASGSDVRGFCAAPAHALMQAAALVEADIYDRVAVVAGGAVAKLGMNGEAHLEEDMPVLEDTLGGFAFSVSSDDGESPVLRTDITGRHTVGRGSSPQAVISALVTDALDRADLSLTDVDKYSVEMQNPEVTEPAGAGNVPESNYKMIAALGVKRGDLEKQEMMNFVDEHGMPGFAPTQGHIPSGVPFIGPAAEMMEKGELERALIIGKGSLFLGRITNQFDGISFLLERNSGEIDDDGGPEAGGEIDKEEIKNIIAQSMRDIGERLRQESE
ncbi:glycine/sarcosine/betaine reductase complex component C subunit beta [Halarsenatibacter silvermanii]|uniref:3-Oxoacyl-[acyl-carrier-protein (ACP)] synthase III n=1 Tax=Halarsenatibacter silvermanii TaxID=321763 RepID=A0A1G9N2A2_9FIRM|nr:glycine/sarcosine/betaine reductase complex component C subunit beta [Halarsenatibacter silvermanii]SDL80513.1 3-Oxoacyl-[acyl-carrier-protein (ACP)] synthase III [Halarsenatibacter silvermanii]